MGESNPQYHPHNKMATTTELAHWLYSGNFDRDDSNYNFYTVQPALNLKIFLSASSLGSFLVPAELAHSSFPI